ncbi:hypothetical protein HYC85_024768 [Camellia sinensis]|uniref:Nitrogen regulatory protein P-II homolog n=1 Tax=Camellia sinensis TaxID=4442 RepID=A0A7J7G923_CAMSI|nr:hypothetical protein HYC85_024768 [Camellia sinensis]
MASSMVKPGALTPLYSGLNDFPLIRSSSIPTTSKFGDSQLSVFNITLKRPKNAPVLPVIRAQSSPDYVPDAKFYKVEAILRCRIYVFLLLLVSDVRGFGAQGGLTERHAGSEFSEDKFVTKVKMEIVVSKDQVESVIDKILREGRTGEIGDGKIFLVPVTDVIRVRTGERGEKAERMMGGRADMINF